MTNALYESAYYTISQKINWDKAIVRKGVIGSRNRKEMLTTDRAMPRAHKIVCLQETHMNPNLQLNNFLIYRQEAPEPNPHSHGGMSVIVHSSIQVAAV
jgi:hypothetical protein